MATLFSLPRDAVYVNFRVKCNCVSVPFILILLVPLPLISLPSLSNADSAVLLFAQLTWNWDKGANRLMKVDEGGLQTASVHGH